MKSKIAASVVLEDLFILNEECFGWFNCISDLIATPGKQFFTFGVKSKIAASVVLEDLFILNEECFGWYYYI